MMNTKLVTGITVIVLLLGLASHSFVGSVFALDAKNLDNKTKTDAESKGTNNMIKVDTSKDKTKSDLPHAMTKQEVQKINREKQIQDESEKNAKDKAKANALIKASQDKSKTDSNTKSKEKSKPIK